MALFALLNACRIEDGMIFHPSPTLAGTPRQVGLEFEDIFFTTRDGVRLNGWFIPHPESQFTLVWFHGNAGNISHRIDNIKLLHDKVKVNVFIFDYRGYGRSEGHASEAGTYLDGEAALNLLRNKLGVKSDKLILFGRSLGAAVAAEMATRFINQGLILESPFISIGEMARIVLPFLPIRFLLQTRYDVGTTITKIRVPLLVLHGDRDEIVPFSHGETIFDKAPEPKKFFAIPGANHNDTYVVGGEIYFQQIKEFVEWTAAKATPADR